MKTPAREAGLTKTLAKEPNIDDADSDQIEQNIAAVQEFYNREEQRRSTSQRFAEQISSFVGRPAFIVVISLFVMAWSCANYGLIALGRPPFDEPPFFWLQGILGLTALLTTAFVLIKQNRIAKLSEQREHLDLKMMMLIEQKTAKMIDLMEELRRDLPNVKDRQDSGAINMKKSMRPEQVLNALDEELISPDGSLTPLKPSSPTEKYHAANYQSAA